MKYTQRDGEKCLKKFCCIPRFKLLVYYFGCQVFLWLNVRHVSRQKEEKNNEKEMKRKKKKSPLSFKQVSKAPKSFTQVIFHLELLDWVHGWPPKGSTFLLLSLIVSSLFLYSSLICPITMISFNKYLLSTYYVPGNTLAYSGYIGEQKFLFSVEFTF